MNIPRLAAFDALCFTVLAGCLVSCGSNDSSEDPSRSTSQFAGGLPANQQVAENLPPSGCELPTCRNNIACTPDAALCLDNAVFQCTSQGNQASLIAQCSTSQRCDVAQAQCLPADSLPEGANGEARLDSSDNQNAGSRVDNQSNALLPCVPNQTWCEGSILNRCSRDGLSYSETSCAVCGDLGGVDGCIDLSCEPSAVTCEGPALVGTCSADGLTLGTEHCPEGTVCQNAGQCAPVSCNPGALTRFDGGEATVYWFGQGTLQNFGDISCGYGINAGDLNNGLGDSVNGIANGQLFGAMNTEDYRDAAACGACVDLQYQGRSVNITIVDECPIGSNPTCTAGHIDLSRGAWNQLTGNAPGTQIFGVNWSFAPCETTGNTMLQLKEPDNQYFNEILVRDHRFPIERVQVQLSDNETWVDAERQRYNYWTPPDGDMGNYRVRVTDVNGAVVEEQLELRAGSQGGSSQFACQ